MLVSHTGPPWCACHSSLYCCSAPSSPWLSGGGYICWVLQACHTALYYTREIQSPSSAKLHTALHRDPLTLDICLFWQMPPVASHSALWQTHWAQSNYMSNRSSAVEWKKEKRTASQSLNLLPPFIVCRHSGGPPLRASGEPRSSEYHQRRTYQIHHLTFRQTWKKPQGKGAVWFPWVNSRIITWWGLGYRLQKARRKDLKCFLPKWNDRYFELCACNCLLKV